MENKICVYAICKNEEQFVEKWYESMKEADAVVVLDTGSTDNTAEKLRALGATVEVKEIKPWRFDVARNESMKLIPDDCNILLCTDLDEVLEPGWSKPLRENWVEGKHERAIYKYTWSHLADGSDGRIFRYDKVHSRNWRWKAPVHELLYNDNTNSNLYKFEDTLDLFDQMHLHHYPDKTKSRSSYLPLLELRAEEDPTDYYGLVYLAHEYYYKQFYDKSIELLKRILIDFKDRYNSVEWASCYLFMGDSYAAKAINIEDPNTKRDFFESAMVEYKHAMEIEPTYIEPYLNIGKVLLRMKDYRLAEYYIKLGIEKSYRHYTWLERDTSWSFEPWDLLCLACYYGNNRKDSVIYAAKALSFSPDDPRLKKNLERCLTMISDKELI